MPIQDIDQSYEIELNKDENGDPVTRFIENEPHTIYDNVVILAQIPSESGTNRVLINEMTEININDEITSASQFKVAYKDGIVYFHSTLEGTNITIASYYGRGIKRVYDARIKIQDEEGNWDSTTLKALLNEFAIRYRSREYIDDLHTNISQSVHVVICKEGTTIDAGNLRLGTIVVVR